MVMIDEQLFGAPPGDIRAMTLSITKYGEDRWGVTFFGHPTNRKDLLELRVTVEPGQGIGTVIGAFVPLLSRADAASVRLTRRSLWAIYGRLGRMGYEVAIEHCGAEPRH